MAIQTAEPSRRAFTVCSEGAAVPSLIAKRCARTTARSAPTVDCPIRSGRTGSGGKRERNPPPHEFTGTQKPAHSLPAMKGSERAATGIWKGACRHYSISNTNTGNVCRRIHNAKFENLFRGLDEKPGRRRGGK